MRVAVLVGGRRMRYNKRKPRCEAGSPMKKVKITMLKATLDEELAKEYGVEGLTACPMFRQGQNLLRGLRQTGRIV